MAFQDVVTPRFYINYLEWILNNYKTGTPKLGDDENSDLIKYASLSNRSALKASEGNISIEYPIEDESLTTSNPIFEKIKFAYLLGNKSDNPLSCSISINESQLTFTSLLDEHTDVDNGSFSSPYNGWEIIGATGGLPDDEVITSIKFTFSGSDSFELSNIGFGGYFDMMHSPELDLTYSKSYDGVQKQKSMGGATLVNYNYLRPPAFGNVGYFELSNADNPLNVPTRTGRRNYQLNFKYLENSTTKDSLFPQSENLYTINGSQLKLENGIYGDDSFYGDVIHMTQGGTIPFIFQADNNNFSGDQFSVCTFDQKDFNFKQVAPSVYDCSLKIVESW